MKILVAFVVVGIVAGALGLKCWSCKNAITNAACNAAGKVQTCKANEACVNQETRTNDGRYKITKGCRQNNMVGSCRVANWQNVGSYPMHCQQNSKSSICDCCCNTDLCNGPQTTCKDTICRKPEHPGDGRIRCPRGLGYESKCFVVCRKGFVRTGPRVITCTNSTGRGVWSPKQAPVCLAKSARQIQVAGFKKPTSCREGLKNPQHGSMACKNYGKDSETQMYNNIGTICTFKCKNGYFLTGAEISQCLPDGRWSVNAPACMKGKCHRPRRDKNRIDQCSEGHYVGSICTVRCRDGYKLAGSTISSCNSVNDETRQGIWSEKFGECVKALCKHEILPPTNGGVECTEKNLLGSWCSFRCNKGFELANLGMTNGGRVQCVEDGKSLIWDGVAPTCARITCPRLHMPKNGNFACVGDGSVGTRCTFRCNVGYDLVGSVERMQTTTCQKARNGAGVWAVESVNCVRVRCRPERTAPLNGAVICTNRDFLGSVCAFRCNVGYDMDGTASQLVINSCMYDSAGDGQGRWSADPPTCSTRFYCNEIQTDPEHGTVSCDNESYQGSICQFTCDEGYDLEGFEKIICRDIKNDGNAEIEWSSPAPVCVPSTCPEQWFDRMTVRQNCNREKDRNAYPVGTRCMYECSSSGYYLDSGADGGEIICAGKNSWNAPAAPRCFVQTCPKLEKIDNGDQPQCTNGNNYASHCRYKCNARYSPTHTEALICDAGRRDEKVGTWDREPPKCVLNECLRIPLTPRQGTVVCSSGTKLGSYCTLECRRGYAPRATRTDCVKAIEMLDGELVEIPKFTLLENFCCAQCFSEIRLVMAVDAQFTKGVQNFVEFAKMFLGQLAKIDNPTSISSYPFSDMVDASSVISQQAVSGSDKHSNILKQMEKWAISEKASDTRAALEYASDTMFASIDSNAANFLIIAADSSPDKINAGLLSKITNRGINIIVATENSVAKTKWEELLNSRGGVLNQDSNKIINRIYDVAFRNGCANTAEECV